MTRHGFIIGIMCMFMSVGIQARSILTFFFRSHPADFKQDFAQEMSSALQKPGKIQKSTIRSMIYPNIVAGVHVLYAGFLAVSDTNGQVVLPLMQEKARFTILVSPALAPILIAGNTISHWQLIPEFPVRAYRVEMMYNDQAEVWYWDVQEDQIPTDSIIPLTSIIIVARPQDIMVPIGITMTEKQPNMILPDIYVKKQIHVAQNALYLLHARHYFASPAVLYQMKADGYSMQPAR